MPKRGVTSRDVTCTHPGIRQQFGSSSVIAPNSFQGRSCAGANVAGLPVTSIVTRCRSVTLPRLSVPPQLRSVFTDDMLHGDHQVVEFAARGREISDRLDVLGFTPARVRLHCQDPIRAASLLMPLRGTNRQPVRSRTSLTLRPPAGARQSVALPGTAVAGSRLSRGNNSDAAGYLRGRGQNQNRGRVRDSRHRGVLRVDRSDHPCHHPARVGRALGRRWPPASQAGSFHTQRRLQLTQAGQSLGGYGDRATRIGWPPGCGSSRLGVVVRQDQPSKCAYRRRCVVPRSHFRVMALTNADTDCLRHSAAAATTTSPNPSRSVTGARSPSRHLPIVRSAGPDPGEANFPRPSGRGRRARC
jgi:hypothetical protein